MVTLYFGLSTRQNVHTISTTERICLALFEVLVTCTNDWKNENMVSKQFSEKPLYYRYLKRYFS